MYAPNAEEGHVLQARLLDAPWTRLVTPGINSLLMTASSWMPEKGFVKGWGSCMIISDAETGDVTGFTSVEVEKNGKRGRVGRRG